MILRGGSSAVECLLPKQKVAGSNPVRRSVNYAKVAQLVEQSLRKGKVVGSTPTFGSMGIRGSRLKRIEEGRAIRTTVKYIVLTGLVILLLIRFGLPALSRLTALVADLTTQEPENNYSQSPLPPPQIANLPDFTNNETLRVTGNTRPGYSVYVYFNDDKTEVLANANGEFTSTFKLSRGENSISALVAHSGQESTKTENYIVNFDNEPPKIELIAPENGKQFTGRDSHTQIEGATEPDAKVTINGRVAIVRGDGKFDFPLVLSEGENTFQILARDKAGNEAELEVKLNYTP